MFFHTVSMHLQVSTDHHQLAKVGCHARPRQWPSGCDARHLVQLHPWTSIGFNQWLEVGGLGVPVVWKHPIDTQVGHRIDNYRGKSREKS